MLSLVFLLFASWLRLFTERDNHETMINLMIERWFEVVDELNESLRCSQLVTYLRIDTFVCYVWCVFSWYVHPHFTSNYKIYYFGPFCSYRTLVTSPRYCLILLKYVYPTARLLFLYSQTPKSPNNILMINLNCSTYTIFIIFPELILFYMANFTRLNYSSIFSI